MAYELHIRKKGWDFEDPSTHLEALDFVRCVARIEGCRLRPKFEAVGTHPQTGQTIRIQPRGPVAEVLLPGRKRWFRARSQRWLPVFHFGFGSVSFKAAFDPNDPEDPVRKVAADLARKLGCVIEGDDGETYFW